MKKICGNCRHIRIEVSGCKFCNKQVALGRKHDKELPPCLRISPVGYSIDPESSAKHCQAFKAAK